MSAPPDRFGLVWLILVFLGMGTLLPWNIFIMQIYYFEARLQVKPTWLFMETNFENILVIGYQVSNCLTLATMVAIKHIPITLKILLPYSVIMLTMLIQTIMIFVYSLCGKDVTFLLMVSVVIMGITCATVQSGVYTKAAMLPLRYINAVIGGQGIAGCVVSVINFITLATVSPHSKQSSSSSSEPWIQRYQSTVQKPAFYYFSTATIIMFLCVIGYIILMYHPFVQYYSKKYYDAVRRRKLGQKEEGEGVVDDMTEPLLKRDGRDYDVQVNKVRSNDSWQALTVEQDAGGTLMHVEGQGKVYDIEGIGFSFPPAVHVVRVPPKYIADPLIRNSVTATQNQQDSSIDKRKKQKSNSLDYRIFSDIFEVLHRNDENASSSNQEEKQGLRRPSSSDQLAAFQNGNGDSSSYNHESKEDFEEKVIDMHTRNSREFGSYENYNFWNLLHDVGLYALVVFLVFFVDMCVFPSITAMIHSSTEQMPTEGLSFIDRLSQDLYMPSLFVLFTSGEMTGRFACGYGPWARKPPPSYMLLLYNLFKFIISVGLLFCNVIPVNGEWRLPVLLRSNIWPVLINGGMGLITGHCGGTAMMHAPGMVPASQRERVGNLITFAFASGLTLGSFLSLVIVTTLEKSP